MVSNCVGTSHTIWKKKKKDKVIDIVIELKALDQY